MGAVELYLLGTPRLERDGKELNPGLRKATALLAYLGVNGQPQSRDRLAGLLWPESDQSAARANLRRTLYRIKKAIGGDILQVSGEVLAIAAEADFWLDASEFRRCAAQGLPPDSPVDALSQAGQAHLQQAADLYAGDFMQGFFLPDSPAFDEWQFFERQALRGELARVLEQLVHSAVLQDEPAEGIPLARRWLALDPLHEPAHRRLMELYAGTGQRAAALRQYQECRRLLEESLGTAPGPEIRRLYELLRLRKTPGLPPAAFEPPQVHYTQSGEVHIAYQVLGAGPLDVLVIAGFVSHLEEIWNEPGLVTALRRLARFSRLILFDKRGVGLSDRVGYPPTLENTVDDVRAVMDAAGSERAVFFGFSEGGPASLLFSATYPERTLGLILYGTMARGKYAPDYPWALTETQYAKWVAWLQETWGRAVPHDNFAPLPPGGRGALAVVRPAAAPWIHPRGSPESSWKLPRNSTCATSCRPFASRP